MKTEKEIEKEVKKTVGRIEALEHLIAEAELGIKMHRKEIDVVSAKLRGLQWCLENIPVAPYEEPKKPTIKECTLEPGAITACNRIQGRYCMNCEFYKESEEYEEDEEPEEYEEDEEPAKIGINDKVMYTRIHTTFNTEKLCTFPITELEYTNICPFPQTTCPKCAYFK
jgi:hypothetical protein